METDKDHMHFLISYDTTDRVGYIVKIVKLRNNISPMAKVWFVSV